MAVVAVVAAVVVMVHDGEKVVHLVICEVSTHRKQTLSQLYGNKHGYGKIRAIW